MSKLTQVTSGHEADLAALSKASMLQKLPCALHGHDKSLNNSPAIKKKSEVKAKKQKKKDEKDRLSMRSVHDMECNLKTLRKTKTAVRLLLVAQSGQKTLVTAEREIVTMQFINSMQKKTWKGDTRGGKRKQGKREKDFKARILKLPDMTPAIHTQGQSS